MQILGQAQSAIVLLLSVVAIGVEVFAVFDCVRRRPDAFVAAGKRTKQFWLLVTGAAVLLGFVSLGGLGFLAIVSISLGVLNLLPIPVLDGGQIVYQSIEGLKGSPLSERAQIVGQQVGIFALILLMSFAFYNDLTQMLG